VILAHSTQVTATLQRATSTIPIVFVNVSNPIEAGFVANLARPGGNLTGVLHYESSIVGKWLSMLKEIAPRVTRIAVVGNPTVNGAYDYFLQAAQAAGQSLAMEVVSSPIEDVATNIERVFESLARGPDCGVVVPPDATAISNRDLIIALTARHRLPAVYAFSYFVAAGGLMSYSTDQVDMFRLSANYVDRILRGDKPADLPVQIPTKYEMTINLTAAKALGLTVPPGLLVAADEVIE
jgi:putative ABC transport system substrate-binding protein